MHSACERDYVADTEMVDDPAAIEKKLRGLQKKLRQIDEANY